MTDSSTPFAVVPVLIGPLQIILTILPGLIIAALSALVSLLHPRAVLYGLKILWRQKLQTALVIALGAGLWYGGSLLWRTFGPQPVVAADIGGTDWPTARGGLTRLGAVKGERAPTQGSVNWSFKKTSSEAFLSSPAVVGNRVYIVSADLSNAFLQRGHIYCFDADTGGLVWKFTPPGYRPTFSSPVVSGKYLVCGEGLHETNDARVICLDISNDREPEVVWTHETKNHVECTPVIWKDRVLVNAGDDGTHCIALEPGPDGKARELWHAPGGKYLDCETALAVHDGKVYLGMGFDGNGLVVFDAITGKEEKRLDVGAPVFSPPSIADGKLYFVKGFADYIRNWEDAKANLVGKWEKEGVPKGEIEQRSSRIGPKGTVCCVDLKTLQIEWETEISQTVLGCVACAEDQLICAARDGIVYVLSKTGNRIGKWESHSTIVTSPAVTDRHISVVTGDGLLCVLDRQNMELVWQLRLGRPTKDQIKYFMGSPVVARGRAYVGTVQDGFVCVGEPGEDRLPPIWPGALGGPGKVGSLDGSSIPNAGVAPLVVQEIAPGKVEAPVAVLGKKLLVPVAEGEQAGLACYSTDGLPGQGLWHMRLPAGVRQSPAAAGDTVWCVDGKLRAADRKLYALDIATGKERWQAPVDAQGSGALLATEDRLLVHDRGGKLASFSHKGERQWEQWLGDMPHAPAVTKTMVVAAGINPPMLAALDRPSGTVLWRRPLEAVPTTSPLVHKERIYLGTQRGLEARSILDGRPVENWTIEESGVSADFALLRDLAVYVNNHGELIFVETSVGTVMSRTAGATVGRPPLVSRDTVLCVGKEGVLRVSLQDAKLALPVFGAGTTGLLWSPFGEGALLAGSALYPGRSQKLAPEVWLDAAEVGILTSPLVLADGHVYAGKAGSGLVKMGN